MDVAELTYNLFLHDLVKEADQQLQNILETNISQRLIWMNANPEFIFDTINTHKPKILIYVLKDKNPLINDEECYALKHVEKKIKELDKKIHPEMYLECVPYESINMDVKDIWKYYIDVISPKKVADLHERIYREVSDKTIRLHEDRSVIKVLLFDDSIASKMNAGISMCRYGPDKEIIKDYVLVFSNPLNRKCAYIITHEIGHKLGLAHIEYLFDIMYGGWLKYPGEKKFTKYSKKQWEQIVEYYSV